MTKTHTTLSLDMEVLEGVKALNINISGEVNDFLRRLIARDEQNIHQINIELERISLEKAEKQLKKWQNMFKIAQNRIEKWEEMQQNREKERLEKEKRDIEASKKCINCGNIHEGFYKWHKFDKGLVCKSCFLASNSDDLARWSKKGDK